MTPTKSFYAKTTSFKLSDQVKAILQEKGFSKIFNYSDYDYFKAQVKYAFNKAQAIADLFLQDHNSTPSDFNDYVY